MLLTISTTARPATDLGFLLFKHPERAQSFDLNFGDAHVFYPEASEERCTAALLVDIENVDLVRGSQYLGQSSQHYINDRPYTANSYTSVALGRVFSTAMRGRSRERQQLADSAIPLEFHLPVVGVDGEPELAARMFEPLGYDVDIEPVPLDPEVPDWGASHLVDLRLETDKQLQRALSELYVMLPVLDGEKHYWVDETEVDKLVRHGEPWIGDHPEREAIFRRYFRWQWGLVDDAREAVEIDTDGGAEGDRDNDGRDSPNLHDQRIARVAELLADKEIESVLDLGCGEGQLIDRLIRNWQFDRVVGLDVSYDRLQRAQSRLELDRKSPEIWEAVELMQGSLLYRDERIEGFDAAALVEVVEHVEPERLEMLERVVFGEAAPGRVIVTTPNRDYNVRYDDLDGTDIRHDDHRFEWRRGEFQSWATDVAERYDYSVVFEPVGDIDPEVGAPSQLAYFRS